MRLLAIYMLAATLLLLTACGQKGPLYLPAEPEALEPASQSVEPAKPEVSDKPSNNEPSAR